VCGFEVGVRNKEIYKSCVFVGKTTHFLYGSGHVFAGFKGT